MIEQHYLDDALRQLRKLKIQADKALAQTTDEQGFKTLDPESNSIAIIMKHMAGNMQSRWTDFLTSDGEKPNRDRDREFELSPGDTRENLIAQGNAGGHAFRRGFVVDAVDLGRPPHSRRSTLVVEAINRQTSHYAAHVGQIVLWRSTTPARAGRRSASRAASPGSRVSRKRWAVRVKPG